MTGIQQQWDKSVPKHQEKKKKLINQSSKIQDKEIKKSREKYDKPKYKIRWAGQVQIEQTIIKVKLSKA